MPEERPDRLDSIVNDLLRGRRPRIRARDADQRDAVIAAATFAGARAGRAEMRPEFRRRLEAMLGDGRGPIVNRRAALVAGLAAAAGALGGVGISRILQPQAPGGMAPGSRAAERIPAVIDPAAGSWRQVAFLADLPDNRPVRVSAGHFSLFLVRKGDRVDAISTVCSHLPCDLQTSSNRPELVCPCHNARFDLDGASLSEDYPLPPLARGRVRVVGGSVEVMGTDRPT